MKSLLALLILFGSCTNARSQNISVSRTAMTFSSAKTTNTQPQDKPLSNPVSPYAYDLTICPRCHKPMVEIYRDTVSIGEYVRKMIRIVRCQNGNKLLLSQDEPIPLMRPDTLKK